MRSFCANLSKFSFLLSLALAPTFLSVACSSSHGRSDMQNREDSGTDAGSCPTNLITLEGRPCAPNGLSCGSTSGRCGQFSNVLTCDQGMWRRVEVQPTPCASDAGRDTGSFVCSETAKPECVLRYMRRCQQSAGADHAECTNGSWQCPNGTMPREECEASLFACGNQACLTDLEACILTYQSFEDSEFEGRPSARCKAFEEFTSGCQGCGCYQNLAPNSTCEEQDGTVVVRTIFEGV